MTATDKTDPKKDDAADKDVTKGSKADKDVITTLTEAQVVIERNAMTKVPALVYKHEIPLLQKVHGEDRVKVEEEYDVEVVNFDVGEEFERLKRKYNGKESGQDVVQQIYGASPHLLAQQLGVKLSDKAAAKPVASSQSGSARPTKPRGATTKTR